MIQRVSVQFGERDAELEEAKVLELWLQDALHKPFEVGVTIGSTDGFVSLEDLVGQRATVSLGEDPAVPRVQGVVRDASIRSVEPGGETVYAFVIVHPVWLLSRRRNQRIFQHQSVVDIARAVLAEHGVGCESRATPPPEREYTTQYGESDLRFVRRILADEGITLVAGAASVGVLLVDDTGARTDELAQELPFIPPGGALQDRTPHARVLQVRLGRSLAEGRATAEDYDALKPTYMLTGAAVASPLGAYEGGLEQYEFEVGNFEDDARGGARARQVLEELRTEARTATCQTACALASGLRFRCVGHPREELAGPLLVVRAEWSMTLTEERFLADCIPARTPYRPARLDKPRIHGTQTAFVVGDPGVEQINVDEHGRIELYFRWDRRRQIEGPGQTRRVRVSQGWAGLGYGFVTLPRVGHEVIVAFLDGDPDEPIVVGRVHNGFSRGPLELPAQKTQSIWKSASSPGGQGFNMIRMEDAAGQELLEFRAQLDSHSETIRNASTIVGVDETKKVGGSSKTEVAGAYSLKSASTSIGTGAYTLDATSVTITSSGPIKETSGSSHTINTGEFRVAASSVAQISAPKIVLEAGGDKITLSGGGITIESGGDIDIKGKMIKLNC